MTSTNFKIVDRQYITCDKDITMTAGDTLAFGIEIGDQDGAPMDVDSVTFIAKDNYRSAFADLFVKTLGSGITREDTGIYSIRVAPSDTAQASGYFNYAVRVGVGDDVFTVMKGLLTIQTKVYEHT